MLAEPGPRAAGAAAHRATSPRSSTATRVGAHRRRRGRHGRGPPVRRPRVLLVAVVRGGRSRSAWLAFARRDVDLTGVRSASTSGPPSGQNLGRISRGRQRRGAPRNRLEGDLHERRRLREADPRPGGAGRARPPTTRSKREGKLILDESDSYGVEMALQLVDTAGGGEVTLDLDGAERRGVGSAHRARDGRGQGDPRLRRRARRRRRARPPRRCSPSASSAPATSTSCSPRPSRPTATPARSRRRSPSCSAGRRSRSRSTIEIADGKVEDPAPDRGRLRRRRGVAARGRERDRRCGRAPLPVVQGDHGGEEQAGRPGDRRRPRPRATRSAGPARARRSRTSTQAPAREAGEKIEDDGTAFEKVVAFLEQLKVI